MRVYNQPPRGVSSQTKTSAQICQVILMLSAFSGYAAGIVPVHDPPVPKNLPFTAGRVALVQGQAPALYDFDASKGVKQTAGDRASEFASKTMGLDAGSPEANLLTGPLIAVATPVTALAGAFSAGSRLTPAEMLASARDLEAALKEVSRQERFQEFLIKAAREAPARNLLLPGSNDPADCRLDARVEQVQLRKEGQSDTSFALHLKVRVRLSRVQDERLLHEQVLEYRSDTALFIDWTRHLAVQSVADTGYRKLAAHVFEDLLSLQDTPILTGPGQKVAAKKAKPEVHPVSFRADGFDTLGVVSFAPERGITYALPQDMDRAYVESIHQTEWQLDGLNNHPNPMVHIPVALIAIPISLGNQVSALLNSAPRRKVVAADAALRDATIATRFSETLAREVASQFPAPGPVVVLREEFPSARPETMPVSNPRGTTLEIRVQKATLNHPGSSSYSTALRIEALGILTSARDQRVIYCCQLNYVSGTRRFDAWAANDARLFREELAKASAEMGRAMAQRLIERDWIASDRDLLAALDRN